MSPEDRIAELEAKRSARKASLQSERVAQHAKDLEAIDLLEESGAQLETMSVATYFPGQPVLVAYRAPTSLEYKRFASLIRRNENAEARTRAQDDLANACWVYPSTKEERKAMAEAIPGVLNGIAVGIMQLVDLKAESEKKD